MDRMRKNIGIFIIIMLLFPSGTYISAGEYLRCVVLDIGEGQSVLLQRGEAGILVDTGLSAKNQELKNALKRYGVTRIEAVILSHLHADHAGGIFGLMVDFPEAVIYETGHRPPYDSAEDEGGRIAEKLDSKTWQVRKLRQGGIIDWRGTRITALWPGEPAGENLNSQSLVVAAFHAGKTILIMGDVDRKIEKHLLQEQLLPGNVEVYVVGHHGAADATRDELVQRISPEYAVISVDKDNKNGYPDKKVVETLLKSGARLHLTSEEGDFVWRSSKPKESDGGFSQGAE